MTCSINHVDINYYEDDNRHYFSSGQPQGTFSSSIMYLLPSDFGRAVVSNWVLGRLRSKHLGPDDSLFTTGRENSHQKLFIVFFLLFHLGANVVLGDFKVFFLVTVVIHQHSESVV